MPQARFRFTAHAIRRMFEWKVSRPEIQRILEGGTVIEQYPDDTPFPSRLVLGWSEGRPIHVVAADDNDDQTTIVITVYQPDSAKWDRAFQRRRQS